MKWVRRPRKDRRLAENAEQRLRWEEEHQPTDPALKAMTQERLRRAVDRAREVTNISAVVTIRTKPRNS